MLPQVLLRIVAGMLMFGSLFALWKTVDIKYYLFFSQRFFALFNNKARKNTQHSVKNLNFSSYTFWVFYCTTMWKWLLRVPPFTTFIAKYVAPCEFNNFRAALIKMPYQWKCVCLYLNIWVCELCFFQLNDMWFLWHLTW